MRALDRLPIRRGAAANQYALIVGLIAVVAILSITFVGTSVSRLFTGVSNRMGNATGSTAESGGGGGGGCSSDGVLDAGFAAGAGANGTVREVVLQSDGKLVIGGDFSSYNGVSTGNLTRLNTDGSKDSGYNSGGVGPNGSVYGLALQSDGKAIAVGNFTTYNGVARGRVVRLNSDGTLDSGFAAGTGANADLFAVTVQSDGKVLIGGSLSSYNGTARNMLARLNSDGTLDTGFMNAMSGPNAAPRAIIALSDGKVLIGGQFTAVHGTTRGYLARLNSDGSVDSSFPASGTLADAIVWRIHLQSDGKIMIAGQLTAYNGTPRGYVARLNSDGTLDSTFACSPSCANDNIFGIGQQSDGKYVFGGYPTQYGGVARNNLARANANGTLDSGFLGSYSGPNGYVRHLLIQPDGKPVIVGGFTAVNGTARGYIARLGCP